ncbi:serine hydrolase domain-containing protein [Psychroserpens sp.]|uniref:serine hydrolase domain-containing protein n=1 Tax=Psychroserpens sp. TaxID=2020870 RepID=UPI002B27A5C0|nr:serine hydrolase domain-containing protein [Psychroserpens sp.]
MSKSVFSRIFLFLFSIVVVAQTRTENSKVLLDSLYNDGHVIGASAGYLVDGEILWESAIGYANKDEKQKFNLDTQVRTASIAKSMTAVAVMQLVAKGLIDLDKPIATYIPEFIQKGDIKITTKHVLSHTSGISAYKNSKEVENKTDFNSLKEAYDVFKDRKLRFEPGTEFFYTSYGYVVLGLLIENVSGMPYETYMQKNIWDTAGMINTGVEKFDVTRENASALYHKQNKGKLKKATPNNLSNRIPGGGFYSTTTDVLLFGNALLNNTLISEESLGLMTQHHSLEKVNNSYGFGFFLYGKQPNEGSIFGHGGAQTGSSTQLFVVPSLKTVIAVMSNTSGSGTAVSTVAGQLIDISQQKE